MEEKDLMQDFEVICRKCGEYFCLQDNYASEEMFIFGVCPNCGHEDEHERTED